MPMVAELLSRNFTLREMLHSTRAEEEARRGNPVWLARQQDPPDAVVSSLKYLCTRALQPCRDAFGYRFTVTSGYRCKPVNDAVGGTTRSQHLTGEAADIQVPNVFLSDQAAAAFRSALNQQVKERVGRSLRGDVNASFYLFAYVCLHLEELDIDQVIHEFGRSAEPNWVHIASSTTGSHRQILTIGSRGRRVISLDAALRLGT
jgi:zinc D-Ala-D-Ala carboxypeptidase